MQVSKNSASFRDPSGFVFNENGDIYRQVNNYYKKDYDYSVECGLYDELIKDGLLVKHKEVKSKTNNDPKQYKILKSDKISTITYPYEWSFSQYKDAALATLEIQRRALKKGMTLKDASAYNIQFYKGRPIFIDTLSFEIYEEGEPWVAYRQFCQHFLAPIALMSKTDVDLSKLMRVYIDGVPLPLASKLLPSKSKFSFGLGSHIHLHARSQRKHASDGENAEKRKVSKRALEGLIINLANTVKKLEWRPKDTEWGDYYTFTNYTDKSFKQKKTIIEGYLDKIKPSSVWDVGANNGLFSRIASSKGIDTVAFDIDPIAVEKNYRQVIKEKENSILPLVMDLTNPSPSIGWNNDERGSMSNRGPSDMVFSLALIHHLAISNNLPFDKISEYFSSICKHLVIEFVPKGDSQVNILLSTRKDIFDSYNIEEFEKQFSMHFNILSKNNIDNSKRTLYLMEKK